MINLIDFKNAEVRMKSFLVILGIVFCLALVSSMLGSNYKIDESPARIDEASCSGGFSGYLPDSLISADSPTYLVLAQNGSDVKKPIVLSWGEGDRLRLDSNGTFEIPIEEINALAGEDFNGGDNNFWVGIYNEDLTNTRYIDYWAFDNYCIDEGLTGAVIDYSGGDSFMRCQSGSVSLGDVNQDVCEYLFGDESFVVSESLRAVAPDEGEVHTYGCYAPSSSPIDYWAFNNYCIDEGLTGAVIDYNGEYPIMKCRSSNLLLEEVSEEVCKHTFGSDSYVFAEGLRAVAPDNGMIYTYDCYDADNFDYVDLGPLAKGENDHNGLCVDRFSNIVDCWYQFNGFWFTDSVNACNRERVLGTCSDGIDNDGDGFVDYSESYPPSGDPGCSSPYDNSEENSIASIVLPSMPGCVDEEFGEVVSTSDESIFAYGLYYGDEIEQWVVKENANFEENKNKGNALDSYWVWTSGEENYIEWDLGDYSNYARVYSVIDHAPFPKEINEYNVKVNVNGNWEELDAVATYVDDDENMKPYDGTSDYYSVVPFRYLRVYPENYGWGAVDFEIDAVSACSFIGERECNYDSDCGEVTSELVCVNDDSYNRTTTPACEADSTCSYETTETLVEVCEYGCANGECIDEPQECELYDDFSSGTLDLDKWEVRQDYEGWPMMEEYGIEDGMFFTRQNTIGNAGTFLVPKYNFLEGESLIYDITYYEGSGNHISNVFVNQADRFGLVGYWNEGYSQIGTQTVQLEFGEGWIKFNEVNTYDLSTDSPYEVYIGTRTGHDGVGSFAYDNVYICHDEPPRTCESNDDCSAWNLPAIATCTNTPDGNPFTWDVAPLVPGVCNLQTNTCQTGGSYQFTHDLEIGRCGVECLEPGENSGCDVNLVCSEDYKCVDAHLPRIDRASCDGGFEGYLPDALIYDDKPTYLILGHGEEDEDDELKEIILTYGNGDRVGDGSLINPRLNANGTFEISIEEINAVDPGYFAGNSEYFWVGLYNENHDLGYGNPLDPTYVDLGPLANITKTVAQYGENENYTDHNGWCVDRYADEIAGCWYQYNGFWFNDSVAVCNIGNGELDLYVDNGSIEGNPGEVGTFRFNFYKHNTGSVDFDSVQTQFYLDDVLQVGLGSMDFDSGTTQQEVTLSGSLSVGMHNITIVVDSANLIDESNELNNVYFYEFRVLPYEGYCESNDDCSAWNLPAIATCTNTPDGNPFTWDVAPLVPGVCNLQTNTCQTGGSYQFTHDLEIGRCGVECIVDDDCEEATSELVCVNDDSYNRTRTPVCNGSYECEFDESETLVEECAYGCSDGICNDGPVCGNDIVEEGETCDDGVMNGLYGFCNDDCSSLGPRCGDGIIQTEYEECDDGNTESGDGCSSTCQTERKKSSGGGSSKKTLLLASCEPLWECGDWGECIDGVQYRSCEDLEHCNVITNKPSEIRACGSIAISAESAESTGWCWWYWLIIAGIFVILLVLIILFAL